MNQKSLLLLFALCLLSLSPAESHARPKCLCFTWAILVKSGGSPARVADPAGSTVIHAGDGLRVLIKADTKGFKCYVFHVDSSGRLAVLFSGLAQDPEILLPEEPEWYLAKKSKGTETYYILAAYELDPLAKAVEVYLAQPGKPGATTAVVREFETARRSYSEPYMQEQRVQLGDFEGQAVAVNAASFYATAVVIRHE